MLNTAMLVIMQLACTAVERPLFGAKALHPGANALRTSTADRFGSEFLWEVVPC